jgi:hypothetical protein
MGVCGSMLKPWRGAPGAVDRTAWFLAAILIAAIENCSGSGWREHGEIMCLNVDSIWGDVGIT